MRRELAEDIRALDFLTTPEEWTPRDEPEDYAERSALERRITVCPPPPILDEPVWPLEQARELIEMAMAEYCALPAPTHALLIKAPPGLGKTHAAIGRCEDEARSGRRVLFAASRRDFWPDLLAMATTPNAWYRWESRQHANAKQGRRETCHHASKINRWIGKGHDAMTFCAGVCGFAYVKEGCRYHAQKREAGRLIMGQHAHLSGGHPLAFDLVVVDETPLSAFEWAWEIPRDRITPLGMDPGTPFGAVVDRLERLALEGTAARGPDLLTLLGGAEAVQAAAQTVPYTRADIKAPRARQADDADHADFLHLPDLARLLRGETEAALAGRDYPARVEVDANGLTLLMRRPVNGAMPAHVIVLDATGNRHLLETVLGRPVAEFAPRIAQRGRIFQVYGRGNGVGTLRPGDATGRAKIDQLVKQVDRIASRYAKPGVITHKAIEDHFNHYEIRGHFYGQRGTNRFNEVDALIVAGIPQPSHPAMVRRAAMLFADRMDTFLIDGKAPWTVRPKAFVWRDPADGSGRGYPSAGFWSDADLQAVLWDQREAELIQAAHRARLNLRKVDVWLLESLPVDELPPDELLAPYELFEAPAGVNVFDWAQFKEVADSHFENGENLTCARCVERGIPAMTARRYLALLPGHEPGRWKVITLAIDGKRGPHAKALAPLNPNYNQNTK